MKRKKIFAFVMAQALALSSVTMPVYASENTVMQNTVSEQAEQVIGETTDEIANAASDAEILPTIEESLSAQEEILVGRPAAAVTECGDEGTFADALVDINLEHPCTFEGEIIIDQAEGLITDESGEELVGADYYATAALLEEDTETAVQILEENGYENVTAEDGMIRADDKYDTGRIFVTSSEPVNTSGAVSVIKFGQTYLIQYASSGEAAIAAEMLKDDPGVQEVIPDFEMKCESEVNPAEKASDEQQVDLTDESQTDNLQADDEAVSDLIETDSEDESAVGRYFDGQFDYKSAAVSYMGIDSFLKNTGTINNVVTVAVLDSGYDTGCTYVSYDRVLVNRGTVLAGSTMRDVVGHGTFVLNQMYEATDNAVQFIPFKLSDSSDGSFSSSAMLSGIYRAVDMGSDFINISAGGGVNYFDYYLPGEQALQYALDNGCYVITAAGNESGDVNYIWPGKSSQCVTISSISYQTGRQASYSNYGDEIDFAAPGGDSDGMIYGYGLNNSYCAMGGTSMAAPYYTAILANLKANGRSFSSLSYLIKGLAGYCKSSLVSNASSYYVGNGCVYLANAINRKMSSATVSSIAKQAYTGSAIKPSVTVKYGSTTLKKGRDYVLSYSNNVNVGTAKVSVTGRGVYKGTVSRTFSIDYTSIANASVTTKYKTYSWTGSARKPAVTVTLNGKTLVKGTDYKVSYTNNVNPGIAKITVTGIGIYRGTATCSFGLSRRVTRVTSGYTYLLVPKAATGRAVALKNGGMANNTTLLIDTKTCAEAQQFKIRKNSDGTYSIISMKCELAMDSYNGSKAVSSSAVIRTYSASRASEKWALKANSDGTFLIINKNSGLALGAENGAAKNAALRMHTKTGSKAQRFYLEQVSTKAVTYAYDGLCTLRSYANAAYAIDVPSASRTSGTVLQVYSANSSYAQQFRFIYSGDGTYRIVNRNSGKVLMPTKSKAVAGAAVVQGTWSGAKCQRWKVIAKSNGTVVLKNCAGYYLEMSSNTAKNGVKLRLNSYKSAKRMMWVRKKV